MQEKIDGLRAIYCNGKFYSRDSKVWDYRMYMHIAPCNLFIMDGEFYCPGMRLQEINAAMAVNRITPTNATKRIKFYIFDIINEEKQYLRLARLDALGEMPGCRTVPWKTADTQGDVDDFYQHTVAQGGEGIILRNLKGFYEGDRSWNLMKMKATQTAVYVCIAVKRGKGKYSDTLGSLTLDCGKNQTVGCSGMTDVQRDDFWKLPPIGERVKIEFDDTSNNGTPLRPRFLTIV